MEVKTEVTNKKDTKEFEALLEESFKKNSLKEGTIIKAKVSEIGKKFVLCEVPGSKFEGVIPTEEFRIAKELDKLKVNSEIEIFLERIESYKNEMVVSFEKAKRMRSWKRMEKSFKNETEVEGIITGGVKGGFVVNVDSCLCFLPRSQIDTKPLRNFDHLMHTPLKFLCVKLDEVRGNIVLSRKAIMDKSRNEDIDKLLSNIKEGDIVKGTVKNLTEWGAFLDLNKVDALLHITDMAYSRVKKPSDLLSVGQTIKVKIIKIDKETKRISCGIKQMFPDPYQNLEKKYKVGQVVDVVVERILDYGAFCKLEDNLSGLLHSSEVSYTKKSTHINKILSVSQKIKVKIIEIDSEKRRISLSYKQTLENPWDSFEKNTPIGSVVNVKITNITDFALFALIENSEFTGMVHKGDLSWKETEENLKKYKVGEKIKAKILDVDKEKEKIRLGIRQLVKDPFDYFNDKKENSVITTTVKEVLKNGIKVSVGNDDNLIMTIKKSHLAKEIEDCRPEIFTKGNKVDCMIVDLDKKNRKANLSIKELEKYNEKIAIKKYGKDGTSSGQVLGNIFGKVFKKVKDRKKEKKDK
tara:strand:+ start:404 stop:2143 length:1740 start_codon:yes stop_codon:yes gene_type:complete